jgi:hypothetical protein
VQCLPAVRGQHNNKTSQRTLQSDNCSADAKDHNHNNQKNNGQQYNHSGQEQQPSQHQHNEEAEQQMTAHVV